MRYLFIISLVIVATSCLADDPDILKAEPGIAEMVVAPPLGDPCEAPGWSGEAYVSGDDPWDAIVNIPDRI